jgi:acyl-CoA reductase-like NAD-dependent aldehyde dehydrogenase
VVSQIKNAVESGAKALVGDVPDKAAGEYATLIQPTVLSGITTEMDIWQRESFGPGEVPHKLF